MNNQPVSDGSDTRTMLLVSLIGAVIAVLMALSTPDAGHVDPTPVEWQDIPTCTNGGRSDCGSVSGAGSGLRFNPAATLDSTRFTR